MAWGFGLGCLPRMSRPSGTGPLRWAALASGGCGGCACALRLCNLCRGPARLQPCIAGRGFVLRIALRRRGARTSGTGTGRATAANCRHRRRSVRNSHQRLIMICRRAWFADSRTTEDSSPSNRSTNDHRSTCGCDSRPDAGDAAFIAHGEPPNRSSFDNKPELAKHKRSVRASAVGGTYRPSGPAEIGDQPNLAML
jgi:hypothetical protein